MGLKPLPHFIMNFSGIVFIFTSCFGLIFTVITVYHLSLFLSYCESTEQASKLFNEGYVSSTESSWASILLKDFLLLCLFIVQHSVMALHPVKHALECYGLGAIQRSLYVIATCISLQCIMRFWEPTTAHLWWIVVGNGPGLRILWRTTHIFSWILIYVGSVVLDMLELLGIRQVFYALKSLPPPLSYKSPQLQRFYGHMRHPSLCGLSIIFWFCPVMTSDRLMLAVVWTIYMAVQWRIDGDDLKYQQKQLQRKTDQLAELKCQFT